MTSTNSTDLKSRSPLINKNFTKMTIIVFTKSSVISIVPTVLWESEKAGGVIFEEEGEWDIDL